MQSRKAFTLIELLVVVAIIGLLITLLLPALAKAKEEAKTTKCLANLHEIALAVATYASQNKDLLPSEGSSVPTTNANWLPDWYGTAGPAQVMGWSDQMYVDGCFQEHTDWKGFGGGNGDGSQINNNDTWNYPTMGYGIFQCPKHGPAYDMDTSNVPSDGRGSQGYSLAWCARSDFYDTPASAVFSVFTRNLNSSHIMVAEGYNQMAASSSYFVPAHMNTSSIDSWAIGYGVFQRHLRNNTLGANYLFADSHAEFSSDYGWAPSPFAFNSTINWNNYSGPTVLPNGAPNNMKNNHVWAHGVSDE